MEYMVQLIFICEECGAIYYDKETAVNFEEHCGKFKACNIEYMKKSIGTINTKRLMYFNSE